MTLQESLGELAGASGFWGVDSALLHYARILGVRCVSYWGPTDPRTRATTVRPGGVPGIWGSSNGPDLAARALRASSTPRPSFASSSRWFSFCLHVNRFRI